MTTYTIECGGFTETAAELESLDDAYVECDCSELVKCPHCMGTGSVPCRCGGDLCICANYGDASCHVCHGDGDVTEERFDRYMDNQRKNAEDMRAVFAKIEDRT